MPLDAWLSRTFGASRHKGNNCCKYSHRQPANQVGMVAAKHIAKRSVTTLAIPALPATRRTSKLKMLIIVVDTFHAAFAATTRRILSRQQSSSKEHYIPQTCGTNIRIDKYFFVKKIRRKSAPVECKDPIGARYRPTQAIDTAQPQVLPRWQKR